MMRKTCDGRGVRRREKLNEIKECGYINRRSTKNIEIRIISLIGLWLRFCMFHKTTPEFLCQQSNCKVKQFYINSGSL